MPNINVMKVSSLLVIAELRIDVDEKQEYTIKVSIWFYDSCYSPLALFLQMKLRGSGKYSVILS